MLEIVYVPHPKAKIQFFRDQKDDSLSPLGQNGDLWLVSHVEAKKVLQDIFLESKTTIFNNSVVRASEYWQWLFSVNCPDWRSVSESLVFTLIEQWFSETQIDIRYQNIEMFKHFFGHALPLMSPELDPLLKEWLTADPSRKERLSGWFQQASEFWSFLNKKKWLGRSWAIHLLNQNENIYLGEFKKYYVDLGLDIRQEEVEILLTIAQTKDVVVLVPQTAWSEKYSQNLDVYKKLISSADSSRTLSGKEDSITPQAYHFSSVLKEAKAVVSQVRLLLDSGVRADKICIVSSDIEDYWDMLREHFLVEGVPLNKKYVLRAISLPSLQKWLSRLNLARKDFEQAQLETYIFSDMETPPSGEKYVQFKKDYSHIYDPTELREHFALPPTLTSKEMSLVEFVDFALSAWQGENRDVVDDLMDLMTQELRLEDSFAYDLWLKYLELLVSRYEVEVRAADTAGVILANFSQADWADVDYAFVLGCEQNRLREVVPNPLSAEDIARIELDLGFYLQRNESLKKEFELRWFNEKTFKGLWLSHSESDFDGQPQIAASLWLELETVQKNKFTQKNLSRWDQLMVSSLPKLKDELGWLNTEEKIHAYKTAQENQLDDYQNLSFVPSFSLSAGSLKKYFDCPFQFYADKILKLKDQREYDLDIDPMFQGQILHKIVEEIHREFNDLNITREQLSELYDRAVQTLDVTGPLRKFWLQEKPRHMILFQNFLDLEKEWRKKFPQNKTIAVEAGIKGFIGINDNVISMSDKKINDDFYAFNGRADRIDSDSQGHLAIVDYKTSSNGIKSFKSWAENGLFQMPLYAMAIEAGLCEEVQALPVKAASYFMLKDKKRGSGYILDESDHGFGDLKEKSSQKIDQDKKEMVFAAVGEEIQKIFSQLGQGYFPAEPRETKICDKCNWSQVCRAPHLK